MGNKLKPYSVLLRRPDYMTGGEPSYFYTYANGPNVAAAVDVARAEAFVADGGTDDDKDSITDYAPVLVLEGHRKDVHFEDPRES